MTNASTVAARLQEAFSESDYQSWAAVTRAANLKSGSTIYDLLKGRTGAEAPSLVRLAYVLGVNALWLQHNRGNKRSGPVSLVATPAPLPKVVEPGLEKSTLREISEMIEIYAGLSRPSRERIMRAFRAVEQENQSDLPKSNGLTDDESQRGK